MVFDLKKLNQDDAENLRLEREEFLRKVEEENRRRNEIKKQEEELKKKMSNLEGFVSK